MYKIYKVGTTGYERTENATSFPGLGISLEVEWSGVIRAPSEAITTWHPVSEDI